MAGRRNSSAASCLATLSARYKGFRRFAKTGIQVEFGSDSNYIQDRVLHNWLKDQVSVPCESKVLSCIFVYSLMRVCTAHCA